MWNEFAHSQIDDFAVGDAYEHHLEIQIFMKIIAIYHIIAIAGMKGDFIALIKLMIV